ncbi:hypothetical protein [Gracilibacillus dipsosauri]|uniref:hypothetical protein n=1 Tax=Gracilibacillus dipsosauri TaxID=178340 RepID=UPI002409F12B
MGKAKDLTKYKFGRLTPVRRVENVGKVTVWLCKCDCGNYKKIRYSDLVNERTVSCGCKAKENLLKRNYKHGMATTSNRNRLYRIWAGMKSRCTNRNATHYESYGGRGITVCVEWLNSFESFRDWALLNGYNDDLSIDRIDVNGNYEPDNCRWVTREEQGRNRRTNSIFKIDGVEKPLVVWCEKFNIPYRTVKSRLALGWDIKKALTVPIKSKYRRKAAN